MQKTVLHYGSWTKQGADPYGRAKINQVRLLPSRPGFQRIRLYDDHRAHLLLSPVSNAGFANFANKQVFP